MGAAKTRGDGRLREVNSLVALLIVLVAQALKHFKNPTSYKSHLEKMPDAANKLLGCTTAIYLSILHVEFGNRTIKGATGRS